VKLGLDAGGRTLQAVGWGMAERLDELTGAEMLDVVYRLERDEYRGTSTIQARLVDFAPTG
jgi:single-stranded-DNA-specific exonuclease